MALQFSAALRNAMADQITSKVGASGLLRLYTGAAPASVAAAETGTKLAELTCNATFAPGSAGGLLTLNAIASAAALATGVAGYFRFLTSAATQHVQGTVTASGGGGDMTFDNVSFNQNDTIAISSYAITAPGA